LKVFQAAKDKNHCHFNPFLIDKALLPMSESIGGIFFTCQGIFCWKALEGKIMGKHVRLDIIDIDQYKRMVGMIWMGKRRKKRDHQEEESGRYQDTRGRMISGND
jgi:hypothetical protein